MLEVEGEVELAAAQSSLPAVACRIIVSSPISLPSQSAKPGMLPDLSMCLRGPEGPRKDTASPLRPLAQTQPIARQLLAAVSLLTFHLNPACPADGRMNAANSNLMAAQVQPTKHHWLNCPALLPELPQTQPPNGSRPMVREGRSTPLFPHRQKYIRGTKLDPQHVNR